MLKESLHYGVKNCSGNPYQVENETERSLKTATPVFISNTITFVQLQKYLTTSCGAEMTDKKVRFSEMSVYQGLWFQDFTLD